MSWDFIPIPFDHIAEEHLQKAIERDRTASVAALQANCRQGIGKLYGVFKDTARVGSILLKLDKCDSGDYELVVVAAGGNVGIDGLLASYKFFDEEARRKGAKFIRMHIVRPALFRMAEHNGYIEADRVFRKEI